MSAIDRLKRRGVQVFVDSNYFEYFSELTERGVLVQSISGGLIHKKIKDRLGFGKLVVFVYDNYELDSVVFTARLGSGRSYALSLDLYVEENKLRHLGVEAVIRTTDIISDVNRFSRLRDKTEFFDSAEIRKFCVEIEDLKQGPTYWVLDKSTHEITETAFRSEDGIGKLPKIEKYKYYYPLKNSRYIHAHCRDGSKQLLTFCTKEAAEKFLELKVNGWS